jgi:photosystem II stability/assembly factor-like uncharacterized protein
MFDIFRTINQKINHREPRVLLRNSSVTFCAMLLRLITVLFAATTLSAQTVQKSNTTENLRGVSLVSNKIAWASGTHGTYLRTVDGGKNWQPAQVPAAESLDFRDVEALGADLAYLLAAGPGDQSRIYKTADAGKSWSLQFTDTNPKGFFDCMAFWDRDHGIAVGDPVADASGTLRFELISTDDGGTHWNPLASSSLPPAIDGEGAFAASGTCIATQGKSNVWFATGGKVARVFRSKDRGKSWSVADTSIVHGPASAGIFSIAFKDGKHGVIAGGDYKQPTQGGANLAVTKNGGRSWKLWNVTPQAYFSAVAFDRTCKRMLAAGTALTIGIQSKKVSKLSEQNLNALSLSKSDDGGIAVGPKGLIVDMSCPPRLKIGDRAD